MYPREIVKKEYMHLVIILGKFSPVLHKKHGVGTSLEVPQ